MANALSFRLHRHAVELTLWQQPGIFARLFPYAGLGIALACLFCFLVEGGSDPAATAGTTLTKATRDTTGWILWRSGWSPALGWAGLLWVLAVPNWLWQRFGRERIVLDAQKLRIEHDYRLFRLVRWQRRYRQLEAFYQTDLGQRSEWAATAWKGHRAAGRLVLEIDRERVQSRVGLDGAALEEAAGLLNRFCRRQHTLPGMRFVLHPN